VIATAEAEAAAAQRAKEEAASQAIASGRYVEVDLASDMLGFIIGKKGANIADIMSTTGAHVTVHSDTGKRGIFILHNYNRINKLCLYRLV
jgi:polyribonucleotide nucleotidyltransferase